MVQHWQRRTDGRPELLARSCTGLQFCRTVGETCLNITDRHGQRANSAADKIIVLINDAVSTADFVWRPIVVHEKSSWIGRDAGGGLGAFQSTDQELTWSTFGNSAKILHVSGLKYCVGRRGGARKIERSRRKTKEKCSEEQEENLTY